MKQGALAELGPIMQLAYVPEDIGQAVKFWTEIVGAGPFFILPHIEFEWAKYRGEPSNIDFSVYIGYWGDTQIELIEQHCDSPSIYKAAGEAGHDGLHHVCLLVDDIKRARAAVASVGAIVEQELALPGGGEAIYVETGGGPGTLVEILQPMTGFTEMCAMMREAHATWDGGEPMRSLG